MEALLARIIQEAQSKKNSSLSDVAQHAYDCILSTQGNQHAQTHILREKVLTAIEQSIDCRGKLAQFGIDGLHILLRDNLFHSIDESIESQCDSLPIQVLNTLHSLPNWAQDSNIQCHSLTIIVQLMCCSSWKISSQAVTQSLHLCYGTYDSANNASVHMAARATVSQIIQSYCAHLQANQDECKSPEDVEICEIFKFCCAKMKAMYSSKSASPSLLLSLDSILAILQSQQSEQILQNSVMLDLIWELLCVNIIEMFGYSPVVSPNSSPSKVIEFKGTNVARMPQVIKIVYMLCGELLRIIGPRTDLRDILELVFEKVFLCPKIVDRLDCLKCLNKIFSTPHRILDVISFEGNQENDLITEKNKHPLHLWNIVIDCIMECSKSGELNILIGCMDLVQSILNSLLELCQNEEVFIPHKLVTHVNHMFKQLQFAQCTAFNYEACDKNMGSLYKLYNLQYKDSLSADKLNSQIGEKDCEVEESLTSLATKIAQAEKVGVENVRSKIKEHFGKDINELNKGLFPNDKQNALTFVQQFKEKLRVWSQVKSVIELDEHFQKFASDFAQEFMGSQMENCETTECSVLNADVVYLTIFNALILIFDDTNGQNIMQKDEFCDRIIHSGCVIYVSEMWLHTVFHAIINTHISSLNFNCDQIQITPLYCIVQDFSGSSNEFLCDVVRLQKATCNSAQPSNKMTAAQKISRMFMTASWNGLQSIIANIINGLREGQNENFMAWLRRKRREESTSLVGDGLASSVSALHKLATICNLLKLQNRTGCIVGQLVEVACPLEDLKSCIIQKNNWPLRASDAFSMEIVLDNALQTATHATECWKYILRCCEFIWELERYSFCEVNEGKHKSISSKIFKSNKYKTRIKAPVEKSEARGLLSELGVNQRRQTVSDILQQNCQHSNQILNTQMQHKIVCLLVDKVDRLFESAARSLNLRSLCDLCSAIVSVSQDRLFYSTEPINYYHAAFLTRLSKLVTDLWKSSRPLSHVMFVWATVNAHFIETVCSDNTCTMNCGLSCLHSCVTGLLVDEFAGFHVNYSLIISMHTTLCIHVPTLPVQDQIVGIIAELVEVQSILLHSGWKALFQTLRALRASWNIMPKDDSSLCEMYRTGVSVLHTYLHMDDLSVFCVAAQDCIACLLKFVQSTEVDHEILPEEHEQNLPEDNTDNHELNNLCAPALDLLHKLHDIMLTLWTKSDTISVNLTNRLSLRERTTECVDYVSEKESLPSLDSIILERGFFGCTSAARAYWLNQTATHEPLSPPWNLYHKGQRAVIELWLTIVEGMVSCVHNCPQVLQPKAITCMHTFVYSLAQQPGAEFGAYCMVHVLLPMIQNWMKREARYTQGWRENSPAVANFKQALGLTTDLTLHYLNSQCESSTRERLLEDSLYVLCECVAQKSEVVSRLGCSSLRHIITQYAPQFTQHGWYTVCRALWRAICMSLQPLRTIMQHYEVGSHQYYGDHAKVQVALRKDSHPKEAHRVRILAQQVFLLDSQKFSENLEDHPDLLSQSFRSIIFLLTKHNQMQPERLAFRDVVISLLSHQLLLQLIGSILLEGCDLKVSGVASLLLRNLLHKSSSEKGDKKLAGQLGSLNGDHLHALLLCLESSLQIAMDFDDRPGLKFLFQKVFNSSVAANLYKQLVSAWTLRCVTLFELGHTTQLTHKGIQQLCTNHANNTQEISFPCEEPIRACSDAALALLAADFAAIASMLTRTESSVNASLAMEAVMNCNESCEPIVFLLASPEHKNNEQNVFIMENVAQQEIDESRDYERALELEIGLEKESNETVYDVVSSDTLDQVLKEYKKHRQLVTMPDSEKTKILRKNAFSHSNSIVTSEFMTPDSQIDPELALQQKQAGLKDGEARLLAWCEMGVCVVELLMRQNDVIFKRMIPVVHNPLIQLTANCTHIRIRLILADYYQRISDIFGIVGSE